MAALNPAKSAVASPTSPPSSNNPTTAATAGKPLTWAQRIGGKTSSSASATGSATSLSHSVPSSQRPGNAVLASTSKASSETPARKPSNEISKSPTSPSVGTSVSGLQRPSVSSTHIDVKTRTPTATSASDASVVTDSGWGESENSNGNTSASTRTTLHSSNGSSSLNGSDLTSDTNTTDAAGAALHLATASAAFTSSAMTATTAASANRGYNESGQSKDVPVASTSTAQPAALPKVNIWQQRKEEQAKRAQELAAQKAAQAAAEAESNQNKASTPSNNAKSDQSSSSIDKTASVAGSSPGLQTQTSRKKGKKGSNVVSPDQAATATATQMQHPTPQHKASTGRSHSQSISNAAVGAAAADKSDLPTASEQVVQTDKKGKGANRSPEASQKTSPTEFGLTSGKKHGSQVSPPAGLAQANGGDHKHASDKADASHVIVLEQVAPTAANAADTAEQDKSKLLPSDTSAQQMSRQTSHASSTASTSQQKRKGKTSVNRSTQVSPVTAVRALSSSGQRSPNDLLQPSTSPSPSVTPGGSLHASLPAKPVGANNFAQNPNATPLRPRTSPAPYATSGLRSPVPQARSPISQRGAAGALDGTSPVVLPDDGGVSNEPRMARQQDNAQISTYQPAPQQWHPNNNVYFGSPNSGSNGHGFGHMGGFTNGTRGSKRGGGVGGRGRGGYGGNPGDRPNYRRNDPSPGRYLNAQASFPGPGMANVYSSGGEPYFVNGMPPVALAPQGSMPFYGAPGQLPGQPPFFRSPPQLHGHSPHFQANIATGSPHGTPQMQSSALPQASSSHAGSPQLQSQLLGFGQGPGMEITQIAPWATPPMYQQAYSSAGSPDIGLNLQTPQQHVPGQIARPPPLFNYDHFPFPPDGTAFWVLGQMEYYLSPDNLSRDPFLRSSMDSEGWIDIQLIASFNRIKQLTTDVTLVRDMCQLSYMLETREMKVRRASDWPQWTLPGARPPSWQTMTEAGPKAPTLLVSHNPVSAEDGLAEPSTSSNDSHVVQKS